MIQPNFELNPPPTAPRVFIVEGIDRLGKSTLIQGIRDTLGYYEVIHYGKPQNLRVYDERAARQPLAPGLDVRRASQLTYQRRCFQTMMDLVASSACLIFDRAHLGEYVYSPLYRNYSGEYVFELERDYGLQHLANVRLILLIETFGVARHFRDDGQGLGPAESRNDEQLRFLKAFYKSSIKDKRIINVTDLSTGDFRPKEAILRDALAPPSSTLTFGFDADENGLPLAPAQGGA